MNKCLKVKVVDGHRLCDCPKGWHEHFDLEEEE